MIKSIIIFSAYYKPGYKGGGPIKTINNLTERLHSQYRFYIITKNKDLGDSEPYPNIVRGEWNSVEGIPVFYIEKGFAGLQQILRILKERRSSIVYLNSFFSMRFSLTPLLLSILFGQQVILGPRGEFSEGALSIKSKKKNIFITLYKTLRLHKGVIFQASTQHEAEDIYRALGNGVDINIAEDIASRTFADETPERDGSSLKVVFVSRISPKKNVLGALSILGKVQLPICFDIYGPIEDSAYWEECQKKVGSLSENVQVNYKGNLSPHEVIPTMSQYDLFFMPTEGENYGHVIAEALCAGVPILISDATPWRELEAKGIGWDLPLDKPNDFVNVFNRVFQMSVEEHAALRERVLCWAKDRFSQDDAVEANLAMFEYALQKSQ